MYGITNTPESFFANMKRDGETGCLLWQKAKNKLGYGIVKFNKKSYLAHRLAWILTNGEIPPRHELHHLPTCNKACCECSHLTLITPSEHSRLTNRLGQIDRSKINYARGARHGMHTHPESRWWLKHPENIARGERVGSAKLTEQQVLQVIELRKKGIPQTKVAKMMGIGETQVGRIERGEQWKHIQLKNK